MELVHHPWVDGEETIAVCWDFHWNLVVGRAQLRYIRGATIHAAIKVDAPDYNTSPGLFTWEVSYSVKTGKVKELTIVPIPARNGSLVIDVTSRESYKAIERR